MATDNEINTVESAEPLENPSALNSNKFQTEKGRPFVYFVCIFLALSIAIISLYESLKALDMQKDQKAALASSISAQKQQTQSQENLNTELADIKTQLNSLNKQLQAKQELNSSKKPDWTLLKAKYYLEMAQINTKWNTDNLTTVALLQQADNLLKDLNQQGIIEIRQAIAKEILELKAEPLPDIVGMLTQINALQALIPSLEIKSSTSTSIPEQKHSTKQATWKDKFQDSLTSLSHLIVIKEDNDRSLALYSPRYESLLRENLIMDLKQAEWAVVQKNQEAYKIALSQAIEDLNRSFNQNSKSSAFSKLINELETKTLGQIGNINIDSLSLLNKVLDSSSTSTPEPAPGEKQ